MSSGILVCGNVVIDTLARPADRIVFDTTTWIDEIRQGLGGNGANTSYAIARLGVRARLMSAVGGDAFGRMALERLESAGVELDWVERREEPTAATIVLVHSNGSRAFLHRPGVSAHVLGEAPPLAPAREQGFTRFHLANPFALPRLRQAAGEFMRRAKEAGLETSLDTAWDSKNEWMKVIGPCLPWTGILFANLEEARRLTGTDGEEEAAAILRESGVPVVVIKLGAAGCAVATSKGFKRVPAYKVDVVDTTGAGDCFAGAFLAALERGALLAEAARLATAVGALSVTSLGATEGLRSYDETLEWMARRT